MRLYFFLLYFLASLNSIAQSRGFFANSDSCETYEVIAMDSILIMKEVNRCENYSIIEQVKEDRKFFSRNGYYKEYSDTSFTRLKRTGHFIYGIETGMWKQYYANGNLEFQGSCNVILVTLSTDSKILCIVDLQNPSDTVKLAFSLRALDSLKNLAQFHYYSPFEHSGGYMFPNFYSLKDGEWLYYSREGQLVAREQYRMGKLISRQ